MPRTPHISRRSFTFPLHILFVSIITVLAFTFFTMEPKHSLSPPRTPVTIGELAPDFTVTSVQGTEYTLSKLQHKALLLAFLDFSAPAEMPEAQPSRAQITFLKSMHTQYGPAGLTVMLIDESRLRTGKVLAHDALSNMTFNWNIKDIPVVNDDGKESIAYQYAVATVPTTVLIGADHRIVERWEGVASTPQLSHRLQALVGLPTMPK